MPEASSKADIRERFQKQAINSGKDTANKNRDALLNVGQRTWYVIDKNEWNGHICDETSNADIGKPFSREEHKDDMAEILKKDEENGGGLVGDMVITALQADYLGTLERAFRSRHHTRIQATLQAAGRKRGHGHEAGLIERGVLGFIQGISKSSKEARD